MFNTKHKLYRLSLSEYSIAIDKNVNDAFYKALLTAFQVAALEEGFNFIESNIPIDQPPLTNQVKERIGDAVLTARIRYISPFRSDDLIQSDVSRYQSDGDSIAWANHLLQALAIEGVYLVSMQPNQN